MPSPDSDPQPRHHDVVIIGSGSGNSLVTEDLADKDVAIVESGTFGGTCLNVGCIPTKMYVYPADIASSIEHAGRLGLDAQLTAVHWQQMRDRIFGRIDPISAAGRDYRVTGPSTTAYLGRAAFVGQRELEITYPDGRSERITGDQVVIATGSRPVIPPIIAESGVAYDTSDTIMRIPQLPERLVIVGGGVIACEFAHVFSAFGTQVSIVSRGEALLRHMDSEVVAAFNDLVDDAWDVHAGAEVSAVSETDGVIRVELSTGETLEGDRLLVATGRRQQSDLGLEVAGVETDDAGHVRVDAHGRTTAEGVWALGDVVSALQLKHVANQHARVVAHNLVHPDDLREFDDDAVPAAVYTRPQLAHVGLTEDEARAAHGDAVVTKTQKYGDTAYGWAMEDTSSICKLVAHRESGMLLGAWIMGPSSSILLQPLVQAMALGTPVAGLARAQYWPHPALTEVVENAILGLGLEDPRR